MREGRRKPVLYSPIFQTLMRPWLARERLASESLSLRYPGGFPYPRDPSQDSFPQFLGGQFVFAVFSANRFKDGDIGSTDVGAESLFAG
jgi:hypothetical protein